MNAVRSTVAPQSDAQQRRSDAASGHRVARARAAGAASRSRSSFESVPVTAQRAGKSDVRLGDPGSPHEREADALAQRLVSGSPVTVAATTHGDAAVARKCNACEAEDDRHKAGKRDDSDPEGRGKSAGARAARATTAQIHGLEGGGAPLPAAERAFFEPRLGRSLSDVRIHTGPDAGEAARAIGARAFTYGEAVAFAPGEYRPSTPEGRRLLAHELVHVAQQAQGAPPVVQRDLATPPPAVAPAAQPDLTPAQIQAALTFNRARYDAQRTREIQDLIGSSPTGVWAETDVLLVARLQDEYGLTKDGKVGPELFRFLDREVGLEGIAHTDDNCLLAFELRNFGVTDGGIAGGQRHIQGHFEVHAQFSRTCGCADYEYRQFIRGHAIHTPAAGAPVDLGPTFRIPGGLPAAFAEDGDVAAAVVNYGHRDQPSEAINRYLDDRGAVDQANGCRYENQDFPGGDFTFAAGDTLDIDINFRGEIRRRGRVVQTKFWSAIRRVFR